MSMDDPLRSILTRLIAYEFFGPFTTLILLALLFSLFALQSATSDVTALRRMVKLARMKYVRISCDSRS
jgi:hypothetical protein